MAFSSSTIFINYSEKTSWGMLQLCILKTRLQRPTQMEQNMFCLYSCLGTVERYFNCTTITIAFYIPLSVSVRFKLSLTTFIVSMYDICALPIAYNCNVLYLYFAMQPITVMYDICTLPYNQ